MPECLLVMRDPTAGEFVPWPDRLGGSEPACGQADVLMVGDNSSLLSCSSGFHKIPLHHSPTLKLDRDSW